ncbi:GNAT family N-acetyltransferase [Granulosicoccaceae sp. 1_MG-2023]|nr:GNAT family N-acetyltransferase [Granulosicoccaceae sp. 1_MG-2023]
MQFATERLLVDEWHSLDSTQWASQDAVAAVQEILTPQVTQCLPPAWQGRYTRQRAAQWLSERDKEGSTYLIVSKSDKQAIGFLILSGHEHGPHLRLGYLLKEPAWGHGYASELVRGVVKRSRENGVQTLTGGIASGNTGSQRVLAKCGFHITGDEPVADQLSYTIRLA